MGKQTRGKKKEGQETGAVCEKEKRGGSWAILCGSKEVPRLSQRGLGQANLKKTKKILRTSPRDWTRLDQVENKEHTRQPYGYTVLRMYTTSPYRSTSCRINALA